MVEAESSSWNSGSLLHRIPQSKEFFKDTLSKIPSKGLNLLFNSLTDSSRLLTGTFYD